MEPLAMQAHSKGLELVLLSDPDVPTLLAGDPASLGQVTNLVGNAIKFTHEGEVVLHVRLEHAHAGRASLHFSVTDTGIGIAPERQDVLFVAFTQADVSTSRKFGGTGLGLSISRELVEMMGGEIGLESREGEGSTFWFNAFFALQPAERRPPRKPDEEIEGTHILLVDGSRNCRRALRVMLESWNCRIGEAPDGATALEKLRAKVAKADPFQVVILDRNLPDMVGTELTRQIKEDPQLEGARLVLTTTMVVRPHPEDLLQQGIAARVSKPVRGLNLRDCLVRVLTCGPSPGSGEAECAGIQGLIHNERRKVRILVAEDNITNQQVAVGILQGLGCSVDVAATGQEAVKALERIPYDLVFMDVQMPEMDGYQATQAIRSIESRVLDREVPIVAMTAHAMQHDRQACLDAGMNDHVSKPVRPATVAQVIRKWLPVSVTLPPEETANVEAADQAVIFNRVDLFARLMQNETLMRTVLDTFLREIPLLIADLGRTVAARDAAQAKYLAHTIKGSAGNVGAIALRQACLLAEQTAEAGEMTRMPALLTRIDQEMKTFKAALGEAGYGDVAQSVTCGARNEGLACCEPD